MSTIGRKVNQSNILGRKATSGMTLGSRMSNRGTHHPVHSNDHEHVHQSSLERTHHLPKDGQMSMTHGGGISRHPWQRKKNH